MDGFCRICGQFGKLSFEHVPPKSAFNDHPILQVHVQKLIGDTADWEAVGGKVQQKGAGRNTLCVRCNNTTGRYYGAAYARWARQGFEALDASKGAPTFYYPYTYQPLCVIKQVICMFLATSGTEFRNRNPELERFVMSRDAKLLPPRLRIYCFYTIGTRSRTHAVAGIIQGLDEPNTKFRVFSETTFPPFGYVMTYGSDPPHERMLDITHFAQFSYLDIRHDHHRMAVLPIDSYLPGDYRARRKAG